MTNTSFQFISSDRECMFPMNHVSMVFILPIILLWTNKCNLHSTSAPSGVSSNFSSSARVGFTPSAICQENILYTNFIIFQVIFLIKKNCRRKASIFLKGYDRWPQNKTESSMTWFVYKKKKESQIDPKWNFVVIVIKEKCSFRSQWYLFKLLI